MTGGLVVCPDCGASVKARGMAAHRRSGRCHALTTRRRYEQRGWRVFPRYYEHLAQICGLSSAVDVINYHPGSIGRKGKFWYGLYVEDGERFDRYLEIARALLAHPALAKELAGRKFARLQDALAWLASGSDRSLLAQVAAALGMDGIESVALGRSGTTLR